MTGVLFCNFVPNLRSRAHGQNIGTGGHLLGIDGVMVFDNSLFRTPGCGFYIGRGIDSSFPATVNPLEFVIIPPLPTNSTTSCLLTGSQTAKAIFEHQHHIHTPPMVNDNIYSFGDFDFYIPDFSIVNHKPLSPLQDFTLTRIQTRPSFVSLAFLLVV